MYNYSMNNQVLPTYVTQYFWGDDLKQLDIDKNKKYIIQVLLEMGNSDALHWLFSTVDKQTVKKVLPTLKLSKKSSQFWNIYLS